MARSNQWKVAERELAKAMNGERTGPRGLGLPDVQHPVWAPEVKFGQQRWYMSEMLKAMEQAETNAAGKKWFIYTREAKTGKRFITIPYEFFIPLLNGNDNGSQADQGI